MKPRSSSETSFRKYPSIDSFPRDYRAKEPKHPKIKQNFLTAHKITARHEPGNNTERNSNIRVVYDFNKEVDEHHTLKRDYSRKSQKEILKRPSTSKKSSGYLLPKLNTDRKAHDDRILVLSEMPVEPLTKMASLSKIEMVMNVSSEEKKKKFRLKQNLT